MIKRITCLAVLVCLSGWIVRAGDPGPLNEKQFEERFRGLSAEADDTQKLRRANDLAGTHPLSSLQVKAIAARLHDDAARLEFATRAYPRVVDPENFYEVYDAFTSFSKVMRLHDRIGGLQRPPPAPVVVAPPVMTDADMTDVLRALRKESFDQTRTQVARQILSSSSKPFLSDQVRQIVACFDFDPAKLELAKFAYDYTADREKYFLVNDAFSFDSTKKALLRYIELHQNEGAPARR